MIASPRVHNSVLLIAATLASVASGCQTADRPEVETAADSLALALIDASGGFDAWDALPALRWDWLVQTDSAELVRVRHVWDRAGDRARVEWSVGQDSVMVGIVSPDTFDPAAPSGSVGLSVDGGPGEPLSGDDALDGLRDAHARWVNDGYWMLAPLKTFDPGVTRELAPDSGAAVLALSFGQVGLTPGDRYWLRLDDARGMAGWTYLLEGDTTATRWTWAEPVEIDGPRGPVRVWTSKRKDGTPLEIRTVPMPLPGLDETLFSDLSPRLAG